MTAIEAKYELARSLLANPLLKQFRKAGFITDTAVRNCKIIREYHRLRKTCSHLQALEKISDKFHLSEERILSILYR